MNDPDFRPTDADNDTYTDTNSTSSDFRGGASPEPSSDGNPAPLGVKATFSRLGVAFSLLTVAMIVAQEIVIFLLLALVPDVDSMWWANWVVSILPLYGVALPVLLLFLKRVPAAPHNTLLGSRFSTYEKPAFTVTHWLRLLVMAFGLMYIGSYIGDFLMNLLSRITGYSYANQLNTLVDTSPWWITALATCVIAPLGEELLFRKLFMDRARRFGDTTAILLSGIIFGLFHGNFFQFFYAAMLGIILAYVYTRSGNILWCVAMHAAVNLMGGTVIPALSGLLPDSPEVALTGYQTLLMLLLLVWIYGIMIAAVSLLIKRFGWRALSPEPAGRSDTFVLREAVSNAGMIVFLILLLCMMAASLIPTPAA